MHPYLPHLLADIAAAHRTEIPEEETEQTIEEHLEAADRWVSGEEPEHTFGYYCGLHPESFPPVDQLSDEEMKMIRNAFEKMMYTLNHGIDLPESLPAAFAYKIIVDSLDWKANIVNSGFMSFDFCSGYAPDCIFKAYCSCLKIGNEKNDDKDII
ncbi:hypothetical protein [Agriterribacter sp.]|uniref:hypothetical protein n=1 Tax=Agriterribacter sp. TaxID=2821509 RepID=UPI002CD29C1B|nr:hypothetical protein [Agriterribacter sp.]HTN08488.1 hypothetical protein [Agriterribacter sp.]